MAQADVYLGIGSNLGNRVGNLSAALTRLASHVEIRTVSTTYETEPVGFADQEPFLNLVCHASTNQSPRELLAITKGIEVELGRVSTFRNGPRTIDIDILLYGNLCLRSEDLVVPHPGMPERSFVLVPLAEIAPDVLHPTLHKTVRLLLEECPDRHWVRAMGKGAYVSTLH